MIGLAKLEHLFDDLALLIYFDRIDTDVIAAIAVVGDRVLESLVHVAQPVLQDIGEADQDRKGDPAQLQLLDEFFQVDAALRLFGRMNLNVAVLAHREITFAPARHVIQLTCIDGRPALGGLPNCCFTQFQFV